MTLKPPVGPNTPINSGIADEGVALPFRRRVNFVGAAVAATDDSANDQTIVTVTGGAPSGAAGGVLSGTYPNPAFAADMATQAELDAAVGLPRGLTGATAATRYVGGTASGAPVSGTFAVGDFIIDQTGTIWICTVAGTPGTWSAPSAGTYTGWQSDTVTWTYASATTFTVSGNVTAQFTTGTRLALTQTTVKYFVVASSAFAAGSTTVTITGGTDYTLANAAITSPLYSYTANPQGWPGWFNWTPTVVGFSGTPTVNARFSVVGRLCSIQVFLSGTSNSTACTFTVPITYSAVGLSAMLVPAVIKDNGTRAIGEYEIDTGNNVTAQVYKDMAGSNFTAAGAKQAFINGSYEI